MKKSAIFLGENIRKYANLWFIRGLNEAGNGLFFEKKVRIFYK